MAKAWRSHPQYHHLFDGLGEPVLVADDQSHYVDANRAACVLLGYSLPELLKLQVADVVASSPAWTQAEYARYIQEGQWHGSVDVRRKNGEVVSVTATARILPLPDGHQAYLSVLKLTA